MLVRLTRVDNVDLSLFRHDFDLTWMAFFMNANEQIYGRFGSRDANGPDTRNSLAGLKHAMEEILTVHQKKREAPAKRKPIFIRQFAAVRNYRGCIHCHQVKEIQRAELKRTGKWDREMLWRYPLPENIGLTLDLDQGNVVRSVQAKSASAQVGIVAKDKVKSINGVPVYSIADASHALDQAPKEGEIDVVWSRGGKEHRAKLELKSGWRRTNITWRPSMLDLIPSLPLFGEDLSAAEKKRLGLSAKRLAFRQENQVHDEARRAGIRGGDVIIGLNDRKLEMDVITFLGHVRRYHLVGETVTINVMRGGRRVDVKMRLR